MVLDKILNSEIFIDRNIRAKVKNASAYFYVGGGYDTETTTLTSDVVRVKGKTYFYDKDTNTYEVKGKKIQKTCEMHVFKKPSLSFVYHIQLMIAGEYITFRYMTDLVKFLKELANKIKKETLDFKYFDITKHPKIIIWVANLQYEFSFLKGYLEEGDITGYFSKDSTSPLYIELFEIFEFRECLGLFGNSLTKIAETYTKTQKMTGDLDYGKIRTPGTPLTDVENKYCYNDVKILDELSYIALDKYVKQKKPIPLTKTGVLRQECKMALKNKIFYEKKDNFLLVPYHEDIENFSKKSEKIWFEWRKYLYSGGLSHSNAVFVGKKINNVKCFDIVSDYPHQMNIHFFPAGELIHGDKKDFKRIKNENKSFIVKIFFKTIHARSSHTFISKSKILDKHLTKNCTYDNGRLYKGENITVWANEIDLTNICSMYEGTFIILDFWYFTKRKKVNKNILQIMNSYYIQKNSLKKEGKSDTVDYKYAKELVNSFYGMFATSIYTTETTLENFEFIEHKSDDFDYVKCVKNLWLNPFVGYWVTSYARNILVNFIIKYPDIIVQYDTDSLYVYMDGDKKQVKDFINEVKKYNQKIKEHNIKNYHSKHMFDLGLLDDDDEYKNYKCLGAKRYLGEKKDGSLKIVIAGCPKKSFISYVNKNNIDPFEFFSDGMFLGVLDSEKLTSSYRHDRKKYYVKIIDYLGNEDTVEISTYSALYSIPFKMSLDSIWKDELVNIINYNKKFPDYIMKGIEKYLYKG